MAGRQPMISIIIPMYGRATYIRECVESIIKQSYQNIEVICVLDGESEEIRSVLRPIAKSCLRIRILTIDHQGCAAARNAGLAASQGEYIAFFDADDRVPEHALEALFTAIIKSDADVALGDYIEIFDDGTESVFVTPSGEPDNFNTFLESVTIWNRLFKKSFIVCNNLQFNIGFRGDDRLFCEDVFLADPRVVVIHEIVYEWLRHDTDDEASITHGTKVQYFHNDLCMWNLFIDNMPSKWQNQLHDHMRYSCYYILNRYQMVEDTSEKRYLFQELKKLVSRIDWEGQDSLFHDIFGMDIGHFMELSEY